MVALLLSSFISIYLFYVFGCFIGKALKLPVTLFEKILMGLVIVNTITCFVSLCFPISLFVLGTFILISFFLIFYIREELHLIFKLLSSQRVVLLSSLPFIVIAFFIALDSPQMHDAGLYHIQMIKWIEEYSVVPGLANLHGRFGFNPNIFSLFALTSLKGIFDQEIFALNFTLFSFFVVYYINNLFKVFKKEGIERVFVFNLVQLFTIFYLSNNLQEASPDFISLSITLYIFSKLFEFANSKVIVPFELFIPIIITCVYILTVKLSILPLLILPIMVIIKYRHRFNNILITITGLCLIVIPWLTRNVVLSGWLIYPFKSIDLFSFDWKVPIATLIMEKESITGWARIPGEAYRAAAYMDITEWFPFWWNRLVLTDKLEFLASLCFPIITILFCIINKVKLDFHKAAFLLLPLLGVIFWLILAPDFRFGKAFIITAALSPLLILKFKFDIGTLENSFFKPIQIYFIVIGLSIILFNVFITKYNDINIYGVIKNNITNNYTPQIISKPDNYGFKTYKISNIDAYCPADESSSDRCFDYNLPCSPVLKSELQLRGNSIMSGFMVKQY